jgi:hypothetical protein
MTTFLRLAGVWGGESEKQYWRLLVVIASGPVCREEVG